MPNLRLKIDLSDFFEDQRRLAYVLMNLDWGHVEDLEKHVQKIFDVPKVHFVTEDGVYLPSRESIQVAKDCNFLKAFMAKRLRKQRLAEHESAEEDEGMIIEGKRIGNGSISSSTPNGPDKKKRRTSMDSTIKAPLKVENAANSKAMSVTVTSTNSGQKADKLSSDLSKSVEMGEETVKTRKRKRVRKKVQNSSPASPRLSCVPVPISSSTLRPSMTTNTPKSKHIYFDEGNDATLVQDAAEIDQSRRVVFRCRLGEDDFLEPREIQAEESSQKKPQILIHENIILVKGTECEDTRVLDDKKEISDDCDNTVLLTEEKDSSDDCNNLSVIEIEDSILKPMDEQQTPPKPDLSSIPATVEQILPISKPLIGLPKIGDIILFKIPLASDGSTTDVTDFICGKCEEVDSEKRKIRCSISDGLDQIEEVSRRCSKGSEEDGSNSFEYFLDELLDTKILQMP